jgi:fructokinase
VQVAVDHQAAADEGIDEDAEKAAHLAPALSLVGLDARGVPSYAFYGEGCADRRLTPDALALLPDGVRAINFGSYATVVGPTSVTQRMLVERERGRTLIAYDPNVRLNVEPRLDAWTDQIDWMLPRTHVLKVSDEDLRLLFPGAEPAALAVRWLSAGVGLVVVTRGGEGAEAWAAGRHVRVPPQRVEVVDTVGAGDTFQAALLTWLAEHDRLAPAALRDWSASDLEAMLDFAGRAAAITCSRRGADLPRRAELR